MEYPEKLLQLIWKCRLYAKVDLHCVGGERVQVLEPGRHNEDAGPDFLHAKIRINGMVWVGHVEVHWNAGNWFAHLHQNDRSFDNVILHVVWENRCDVRRHDGTVIPTLCLQQYIAPEILPLYHTLFQSQGIACASQLHSVPDYTKMQVLDRMVKNRLEAKTVEIFGYLAQHANDWEKVTQHLFAESFGMRVNKHAFARLIAALPGNILDRYQGQRDVLDALLFGQAALLPDNVIDHYTLKLKKTYLYLRRLHRLNPMETHEWRFLRMRPANFPTIRIAQLSSVFAHVSRLCQLILSHEDLRSLQQRFFDFVPSAYWATHYQFGKVAQPRKVRLTPAFLDHIAINCFVPLLYSYGHHFGDDALQMRAIDWLNQISAESNTVTTNYERIGLQAQHAADSQALLHLHQHHCERKKCLSCAIGVYILKRV